MLLTHSLLCALCALCIVAASTPPFASVDNKYNYKEVFNGNGRVVAFADINNDGLEDFIVLTSSNQLVFYIGQRDDAQFKRLNGTFQCKGSSAFVHFASFFFYREASKLLNLMITYQVPNDSSFFTQFLFLSLSDNGQSVLVTECLVPVLKTSSQLLLGDFTFEQKVSFIGAVSGTSSPILWTFNADGSQLLSNSSLFADRSLSLPSDNQGLWLDIDSDAVPELLLPSVTNGELSSLLIWKRAQTGTLKFARSVSLPSGISVLKAGDLFGSGQAQLICAFLNGTISIFQNSLPFCSEFESNCVKREGLFETSSSGSFLGFKTDAPIASGSLPFAAKITSLRLGDVGLNGTLDCVVTTDTGEAVVFETSATALSPLPLTAAPNGSLRSVLSLPSTHKISDASFVGYANGLDFIVNTDGDDFHVLRNAEKLDAFFVQIFFQSTLFDRNTFSIFSPPVSGSFSLMLAMNDDGSVDRPAGSLFHDTRLVTAAHQCTSSDALSNLSSVRIGFGRSNNFITSLAVVSTITGGRLRKWDNIIPNARLVAFCGGNDPSDWYLLIYYSDGTIHFWIVLIVVTSVMLLFGTGAFFCHRKERAQDYEEKVRSLLRINFDAL